MKERKKPKYDMEPRYVLLIMTMVCIFLIFFSYRFSDLFGSIRTRLNSMIIPMQKGITTIGNGINNTIDRFEEVDKLQKEIMELKAENERITREKERILSEAQAEISEMVTDATEKLALKATAGEAFDQFLDAVDLAEERGSKHEQ